MTDFQQPGFAERYISLLTLLTRWIAVRIAVLCGQVMVMAAAYACTELLNSRLAGAQTKDPVELVSTWIYVSQGELVFFSMAIVGSLVAARI